MSYRRWILVAAGLFTTGMAFGLVIADKAAYFFAGEITALEELTRLLNLEPFTISMAAFIFLKNTSALLFSFIFSPLLCLVPVLALTVNGGLLSFVSVIVIEQESVGLLLAGLLPHGILEIPALIIGEAAALSFGMMTIIALISRKRRGQLIPNLKQNIKYMALAFALLLPAAIIETYITPIFLG
ncbi:MAG TPA: stage II sporulation protein M [Dehalococcoidales bacterium]|nr:stage II sporulation protein M [Dehalococcoidales bacterium]